MAKTKEQAPPAVRFTDVTFGYTPDTTVLHDVSFAIERGEYVCVVGHNGSGKSTISKVLMGLLMPRRGAVAVNGVTLSAANLKTVRNDVGIVFQNPDNQFVGMTTEDDIAFGLENRKYPRLQMQVAVRQAAEQMKITHLLSSEPGALSGGQKQKVAIAGMLAFNPSVMIFDESTSMLDPKGKAELKQTILDLRNDGTNRTIISITHDMEEVVRADRVLVMYGGRVKAFDTPAKVFKDVPFIKSMRLDVPLAARLSGLLAEGGMKVKTATLVDDLVEQLCR